MRNAEQSNSLLVIPNMLLAQDTSDSPLKSPTSDSVNKSLDRSLEEDEMDTSQLPDTEHEIRHKPILKIFYDYMECRQTKPRVKKIQELLKLTLYTGPENEHQIDPKSLFTRRQLFDATQCSAMEFDDLLNNIHSVKVNGFLRLLDYGYEYKIVSLMLALINENSWSLDEIDKEETVTSLDGIIPEDICRKIFEYYTEEVLNTGKFRYNARLVCRILAQNVLQENLKFHIDEFLETCQGGLPEGMQMDESFLAGIGIVDRESNPPNIRGLFEENLPMNLLERFRILFKTKEKWTMQQIEPYISPFSTPQLSISAILAKSVRSVVENGIRYYISKHN